MARDGGVDYPPGSAAHSLDSSGGPLGSAATALVTRNDLDVQFVTVYCVEAVVGGFRAVRALAASKDRHTGLA